MNISKEQADALFEVAKPLMQWLAENAHPHCCVVVDVDRVEVLEAVAMRKAPDSLNPFAVPRSWSVSKEEKPE